ncbi:MAG: ferrous iron transport protein B [Candidatus Riflebacteria bacterium]|nr:ferrous iron transport protein B [Candidatus Riflebacteria bacterium]
MILLIGNPNAGKTSLFNALTGEHRQVGNWPGITVERLSGHRIHRNIELDFLDLPGTYSIHPFTPEEQVAVTALSELRDASIINVLDGTNLERNLVLTFQLLERGFKPILVINFADELERRGGKIDGKRLAATLGLPVFMTNARLGFGIDTLLDALVELAKKPATSADEYAKSFYTPMPLSRNGAGCSVPEPDSQSGLRLSGLDLVSHDDPSRAACERFERIGSLLSDVFIASPQPISAWQNRLDDVVTHRLFGIPLFFIAMALIFWSTFTLSTPVSHMIDSIVSGVSGFARATLPASLLSDLFIDGILTGVGGVLVFIPSIAVLFLWIAILEDSGYMSRAAFLVDRFMRGLGLHGRAFLPLVMGFGCNVPAVMSTRILDDPAQRRKTMFLIPMMGCSARLPVLTLLAAAFFHESAGLYLFAVYLINFMLMLLLARIAMRLFPADDLSPFLLEMPPFRWPTLRSVMLTLREKLGHFIEKAATVILAGAIVVWALNAFPRDIPLSLPYDSLIASLQIRAQAGDKLAAETVVNLTADRNRELISGRYITRVGHLLEPIVRPFGCGWREGVALIPGFLAKESIISTLAVLYRPLSDDLGTGMRAAGLSPLAGLSLMLFTLLYVPCLPTVGVIYRESCSLNFTIVAAAVPGVLAWIVAVAIYRIGILFL